MKYLFFISILLFIGCLDGSNNIINNNSCKTEQDCLNGYICNDNHECVKFVCSFDSDCRSGEICEKSECLTGCRNNEDCKNDKICNSETLKCEKKVTCIEDASLCKKGYICDIEFKKCRLNDNCMTPNDCPDNYDCFNNICKKHECSDESCGENKICENNSCIIGCRKDDDCDNTEVCNLSTLKCEDKPDCRNDSSICNSKQNCNATTGLCEDKDCRANEDICEQGYICDVSSGKCKINNSCTINRDCPENYNCKDQECVEKTRCTINAQCAVTGEVCRANGYCGPDTGCEDDSYCVNRDTTKPYCNTISGLCYECVSDEHCSIEGETCGTNHTCSVGGSLDCQNDSDCGLNRKCNKDNTPHVCESVFTTCECTAKDTTTNVCTESDCPDNKRCLIDQNNQEDHCVECLQDNQCLAQHVCNNNTNLCEDEGSGVVCTTDGDCNTLGGEKCLNSSNTSCAGETNCTCRNPNSSGNDSIEGLCDSSGGMILCLQLGMRCSEQVSGDCIE